MHSQYSQQFATSSTEDCVDVPSAKQAKKEEEIAMFAVHRLKDTL